jgi:molecular chaperone GrpE
MKYFCEINRRLPLRGAATPGGEYIMHKTHDEKHNHKHVKSNLEIAMEKAKTMPPDTSPKEEKAKEHPVEEELKILREKAAKADEYYDRLLRTAADLENYKKRVERDRRDLIKFANEELMAELTTVLDNFERALKAAAPTPDAAKIVEGVKLIQKQLLTVLEKHGLKPIAALGMPFNPEFHEAVAERESDRHPEGTIVDEQLKGYTLSGRLLRPAVVTVSKSKTPPAAEEKQGQGNAAGREPKGGPGPGTLK